MIPSNIEQLNNIRNHCKSLSTKKAIISACVGWLPVADIAVDVWILLNTLPQISKEFGLTPEQINQSDDRTKHFFYEIDKLAFLS